MLFYFSVAIRSMASFTCVYLIELHASQVIWWFIIFLNNISAKYHIVDLACKYIDRINYKKTWKVIYVFNFILEYIGTYPFRLVSNHSDGLFIEREVVYNRLIRTLRWIY